MTRRAAILTIIQIACLIILYQQTPQYIWLLFGASILCNPTIMRGLDGENG